MKLFHLSYLCFVSQTLLPHVAKCLCCIWLMKTDCWISARLTGLCVQHCAWKWPNTAWATPVHCDSSLSYRRGRKGALHPSLSSKDTTIKRGRKSDSLIPYELGIANLSSTLPFTQCILLLDQLLRCQIALCWQSRGQCIQTCQDFSLLSLFLAHLSKQTCSQQSMTIQNRARVWKCESQLQGLALPCLMFHLRH